MSESAFLSVNGISKRFATTSGLFGRHTGAVKAVGELKGDDLKQFRTDVQAVFQDPWA